jgi:predicted ribosomally synthesized peptide with SipW-like signal peptide
MSTMVKNNKKKLIAGAVAGAAALALISGGTFALWSDFDSIEGNELAAGTLTLELGQSTPLDVGNLAPGENKATTVWIASRSDDTAALQNARLTGTLENLVGQEDGCVGNSEIVDDPDCNDTASGGEFPAQAYIQFAFKTAVGPDDCGSGGGYSAAADRQGTLAAIEDRPLALGEVDPGQGICIRIEAGLPGGGSGGDSNDGVDFPGNADSTNAVQGDSATFDVKFDLTQVIPN